MKSQSHGNDISAAEVTNISTHGIWLYTHGEELFLSYEDFPWFKDMPVAKIINIEEQSVNHFYWPDLDVDLTKEMIEHPDKFPLKTK